LEWTSGLVMLKAWGFAFTTEGEGVGPWYKENHCHVNFPETTHVVKVLFNGGVSLDGVHSILPTDTDFFTINKENGDELDSTKFLGLADLGEEFDSYF